MNEGMSLEQIVNNYVDHLKDNGDMPSTATIVDVKLSERGSTGTITVILSEGPPLSIEYNMPTN